MKREIIYPFFLLLLVTAGCISIPESSLNDEEDFPIEQAPVGVSSKIGPNTVYVEPLNTRVKKGDLFKVAIMVSEITGLVGFQFDIEYTPEILEFTSLTIGSFLGDSNDVFCIDYKVEPGLIRNIACSKLGGESISGEGALAIVDFKVIKEGEANISLDNVKFVDSQAAAIPVKELNAQIIVIQ